MAAPGTACGGAGAGTPPAQAQACRAVSIARWGRSGITSHAAPKTAVLTTYPMAMSFSVLRLINSAPLSRP